VLKQILLEQNEKKTSMYHGYIIVYTYRVSVKKVPFLIEFLVGITLKIQLKGNL